MAPVSTVFVTSSTAPWWRSAWRMSSLTSSGRSIIRPSIVTSSSSRPSLLLVRDHLAEELELLAIEALELHRFDRREVARTGADGDAREQRLDAEALQTRRLLHDVLARERVAALLEHLLERGRHRVAVDVERVARVAVRVVLGHELAPRLHCRVIRPALVGRVLDVGAGDDAHRLLEPRGLEHRAHRVRHVVQVVHGLPAAVIGRA